MFIRIYGNNVGEEFGLNLSKFEMVLVHLSGGKCKWNFVGTQHMFLVLDLRIVETSVANESKHS